MEHGNNVDDEFTEDVRTLLISDFPSNILWLSTILISNAFCIWVSWREQLSQFSTFLLPKLTIILII